MKKSQQNGTMGTDDLDLQVGLLLWEYDSDFSLHTVLMTRK